MSEIKGVLRKKDGIWFVDGKPAFDDNRKPLLTRHSNSIDLTDQLGMDDIYKEGDQVTYTTHEMWQGTLAEWEYAIVNKL